MFGDGFGLEAALWFQQDGEEAVEDVTFGRSNAWDQVRQETLAVRSSDGLWETTGFSKFKFSGPGAARTSIASWPVASRTPVAWHSRR